MELITHYLLLCAATATCAMTISKMKVAAPLHDIAAKLGQVWLQDLLTCPYCLSVWFAMFWVIVTQSVSGLVPTIFMALAVAGGGVLFGGAMYRIMMLHEKEVYALKAALKQVRQSLDESQESANDLTIEVLQLRNHIDSMESIKRSDSPRRHEEPTNGFTPPQPMPPARPWRDAVNDTTNITSGM